MFSSRTEVTTERRLEHIENQRQQQGKEKKKPQKKKKLKLEFIVQTDNFLFNVLAKEYFVFANKMNREIGI